MTSGVNRRPPTERPAPLPRRRPWRWLLLLGVVAVLAAAFLWSPWGTVHRLHARSLAVEWGRCLAGGEPPAAQPEVHAAFRAHSVARKGPPVRPPPGEELPVVEPRLHVARDVFPHPDRPGTVPRRVVVAVIDSGVRDGHPDVDEASVLRGIDLVNPCGDGRQDVTGHGTMVAGVIASQTHGGAPGVRILPVRVSLATGQNPRWLSAAAIWWSARNGADVINMSFSTQRGRASVIERLAVAYAEHRGIALVGAAGNDPSRVAGYPAAYPSVLSVTSINGNGELSVFAARSGKIDVAAPGTRVLTLAKDGSFRTASGTSFAAPVVSAAIAQLLTAYPELSGAEASAALRGATDPPQWEQVTAAFGVLNLASALLHLCEAALWCEPEPDVPRDPASVRDSWESRWQPVRRPADGWLSSRVP